VCNKDFLNFFKATSKTNLLKLIQWWAEQLFKLKIADNFLGTVSPIEFYFKIVIYLTKQNTIFLVFSKCLKIKWLTKNQCNTIWK